MGFLQSRLDFSSVFSVPPCCFPGRTVAAWMPRWCTPWRPMPGPRSSEGPVCRSWPGPCPTAGGGDDGVMAIMMNLGQVWR